MTAIGIMAPDGNRVVGLYGELPLRELMRAKLGDSRVTRVPSIDTQGDWPFQFDRIYVATGSRWKAYRPDYLPMKYW